MKNRKEKMMILQFSERFVKTFKVTIDENNKTELLARLEQSSIGLNKYAYTILNSDKFVLPAAIISHQFIETSILSLGFEKGALTAEIESVLPDFGLALCPIESAPFIRLTFTDQVPSTGNPTNQSPPGAIIILSKKLDNESDFPNGFYLRNIDGQLWLRGHNYSVDYIWKPSDKMIFRKVDPDTDRVARPATNRRQG